MNEHPTKQELDGYCARVLAPVAFLSIHRHVATCPRCAEQCNSPEHLARDLAQLNDALISAPDDTPYHLSAVEVAAYQRGGLDEIDLEIVESHLGICNRCLSEVQRHAAESQPPLVRSPASKPRHWPSSLLVNKWGPWRVAAILSCVAAVILLALWLFRTKPPEPEPITGPANLRSPKSSARADIPG